MPDFFVRSLSIFSVMIEVISACRYSTAIRNGERIIAGMASFQLPVGPKHRSRQPITRSEFSMMGLT